MKRKYSYLVLSIFAVILLAGCGSKAYDEAMSLGKEKIEEEQYEEAVIHFDKAVKEDSDNEEAAIYLQQTKTMITGVNYFNDEDYVEAEKAFQTVKDEKKGSKTLVEKAEEILAELVTLTEQAEAVEEEVADTETETETETESDQSATADSEKNESESTEGKQEEKTPVTSEKDETATADNKKQELIQAVQGYWVNISNEYQYCSFTNDAFVCPTDQSDEYYFGDITAWDANLDYDEVHMTLAEGGIFNAHVSDGILTLNNGNYRRITELELLERFGDRATINDFFDINKYKTMFNAY